MRITTATYALIGSEGKPLTFSQLRIANCHRLPLFKNARGERAHTEVDGSDWTPADWLTAVVGELGEAANIMKKIKRGDFAPGVELDMAREALAFEFADVATYLDILAFQHGVDLGEAIREKFNMVSKRVDCKVVL